MIISNKYGVHFINIYQVITIKYYHYIIYILLLLTISPIFTDNIQ